MSKEERKALEAEEPDDSPMGAILITTLLLITILTVWFGMYLLNLVRA